MLQGIRNIVLPLLLISVLLFPFTGCAEKEPVPAEPPAPETITPAPPPLTPAPETSAPPRPAPTPPPVTPAPETPAPTPPTSAPETPTPVPPANPAPQEPPGESEIDQILYESALAVDDLKTLKSEIYMVMAINVAGGSEPGKVTVDMSVNSTQDNASHQAYVSMDVHTAEQIKQSVSMMVYALGEWMYVKTSLPLIGEYWMKMGITDEMRKQFDLDMAEEQLKLYRQPSSFKFLKYENINGTECYVIDVTPAKEALREWISQQTGETGNVDWANVNISDLFKKLSFTFWIARDSKLLVKMNAAILLETSYQDVGATAEDFEKMSIDINMEMRLYDHNKPVTIILPKEAEGALEIPLIPSQGST